MFYLQYGISYTGTDIYRHVYNDGHALSHSFPWRVSSWSTQSKHSRRHTLLTNNIISLEDSLPVGVGGVEIGCDAKGGHKW